MSIDSTPNPKVDGSKSDSSFKPASLNKSDNEMAQSVDYFGDSNKQETRVSLVNDAYGLKNQQPNETDDRFGWESDTPINKARHEAWSPDDRRVRTASRASGSRLDTWSYYDYVDKATREKMPDYTSKEATRLLDQSAAEANGQSGRLVRTSQGVYIRSNFDVDVDGSPRARQIDSYGQTRTSLSYSDTDGHKYINAEEVPYIVLPGGKYKQYGVNLGDYALVRDTGTGRVAVAVFADVGPSHKTGEGSIHLANSVLGLDVTPNRGISERRFEYLVFPGSGHGRPRDQQDLMVKLENFKKQVGVYT